MVYAQHLAATTAKATSTLTAAVASPATTFDVETEIISEEKDWSKTFVSLLADAGGLIVILYILFATLNYLLTWNKFENYLVSELFSQSAVGD